MKIVLLGYMASGKSSIGKKLSKSLEMNFIDLDDYIIEKEKKSISDIFKENGEIYFRLIETKYLKEILSKDGNFILSLGGGTPCYANNMEIVNQAETKSIYLQGSVPTMVERLIRKKAKRPLIASLGDDKIPEFVAKHLFERRPYYEKAKVTIKIDDKKKSEVAEELYKLLS
ncbi:shikimate kinase [Polaribacter reichenbachii]|uniref:Shikimate kinase n=1 Tax=Polaribacter reichenbachii TaxID=996801 RepID=A0A1B8TPI7_9FLAO|nr:shikimate kinase [Polaribacter reichenbachii]APZ46937.1 shikimate kinase [Polaribacter reichenbachii]AUC17580.1 shikimate kinase [Polaribacter reichenbachii]OBY61547.1 shikimate kinase [Polaribacter reichenbachii]